MITLLKVQIQSLFSSIFTLGRPAKKRGPMSRVLVALLFLYIAAALGSSVGFFFSVLYAPLRDAGLRWLYFSLGGISAFVISFVGSVFLAQSALYEAKDNELLLSMPIRPGTILASRFTTILASAFLLQQLFLLPGAIVWWLNGPTGIAGVVMYVLVSLLLPFMVAALSGLGGYALMRVASRVRRKSLVLVILSLAFLGAYFYGYSRLMGIMNTLAARGAAMADAVRTALFPAYHFGLAIDTGSVVSLLLFALCCVIPFALVYALISGRYLKMLTEKRGERKIAYVSKELKAGRPFGALVGREIKRFTSSATYMMNASLGLIFMPVFPFLLLFNPGWQSSLSNFEGMSGILAPASAVVLCLLCASVFISAPSISLEGRSLWIAQTLPVSAGQVVFSKAATHALLTVPFQLLSAAALAITLKTSLRDTLALFLLPLPVIAFTALLGVALNLRFPKLEWRTVTEPVKQGASTILAMFGAVITVGAPVALWVFELRGSIGMYPFMLLYALFFVLLSAALYLYLGRVAHKSLLRLGEK